MPRIPSEAEEDEIANQDDDRAETAEEVQAGAEPAAAKPAPRVVQYDDRAKGTAPGTSPHSIEYEARPIHTIDDLDPAVRAHLKAAKEATRKRLAELDEDVPPEDREPAKPAVAAAPAQAPAAAQPAPVAAPAPVAPVAAAVPLVVSPPAAQPAAAPEVPTLDPRVVKAFEVLNAQQVAFEAQKKEWETTAGARQKKLDEIVEKFDYDPVAAIRELAAFRLGTEEAAKLDGVLDEVYDDLTGHRLKLEADDGKKAKRESRRSRVELERYKQEQRADAERVKREAEAERTRAEGERETQTYATWLSGTAPTSYSWLRAHEDAPSLVRDVIKEFGKYGQQVTPDQAAAFADNQLKERAQAHFTKFKHLLAPDQTSAAASAVPAAGVPGAVTAQAPTQPVTPPPANSQRTRDLTNTATATTPTTPPTPPKKFDPNEDPEESRRGSLARWAAKRKAQQQQP
jgi:hypothetical protein